jgi:hypothetical protein
LRCSCCQSPQTCTAFAEIFLCLNSADQLKVEPTGQVTLLDMDICAQYQVFCYRRKSHQLVSLPCLLKIESFVFVPCYCPPGMDFDHRCLFKLS